MMKQLVKIFKVSFRQIYRLGIDVTHTPAVPPHSIPMMTMHTFN